MGNFSIKNIAGALICALFILLGNQSYSQEIVIQTDGTLHFCGDSVFRNIGDIVIEEIDSSAFQTGVFYTYRIGAPTGYQFQPGVGAVDPKPGNKFENTETITVTATYIEIGYEAKGSSATKFETITIKNVKMLAEYPGLGPDTLFRVASSGTEAVQTGNAISDKLIHGIVNSIDTIQFAASTIVQPLCNGENSGSITINASGGGGGFVYSIDTGLSYSSSNIFNTLVAGNYRLQILDDSGCTQVGPLEVLVDPPAISISAVLDTNISCFGANDGTIDITASGGTGILNYSIDNGSTYQVDSFFTGLSAGPYNPAVTDANACEVFASSVSITEPSAISILGEVISNISCNGLTDGSITISASGGTAPLEYSIDNGVSYQASNIFSGLGAIAYDIEVRDANLCVSNGTSGNIIEPTGMSFNASGLTSPTCNGGSDGQIIVNVVNGTPPLSYSIDNGSSFSSGNTFSGLSSGSYDLVSQDDNGCLRTGPTEILTDPPVINISLVTPTNVVCNGANDGTITITASGGTGTLNYSITGAAPFVAGNVFNSLSPGSYVPAVEDANGCVVVASSEGISEPTAIVINNESITDISCNTLTDGSITITASGGSPALRYSITGAAPYQASAIFSGLGAVAYSIIVQDNNGCTQTGTSGNIIEPTALVPGSASVTNVSTAGGSDGIISILGTSGATSPYLFSLDGGTNTQSSATFGGLMAGSYNVTVIDDNGCSANINGIVVTEPGGGLQAGGVLINGGSSFDVCNGATTPAVNLTSNGQANGGNTDSTLHYQWQSSPDGAAWADIPGAIDSFYLVPTPYTASSFFRREALRGDIPGLPFEGPVYTNFILLNVNALPIATITINDPDNLACVEGVPVQIIGFPLPGSGSGVFTSVPGTAALVDNGNGSATFSPGLAPPAGYTITYTYADAIGCGDTDNDVLTISENTSAMLTIGKNSFLITDPTEPLIGNPVGGNYSGPGISGNSFTPLIAGVGGPYNLHYVQTDANGCIDSATQVVNVLDTGGSQIRYLDPEYCEYQDTSMIRASMPSLAISRSPFWRINGDASPGILTVVNDTVAIFDPTAVVNTNSTITISFLFSKGGNPDSATQDVVVFTKPVVSISGPSGPFCDVADALVYTGIPTNTNGAWYSTNIVDNGDGTAVFDPNAGIAGPGNHDLNYLYVDNHSTISCTDSATFMVVVNPLPSPAFTNLDSNYCTNAGDTILIATPTPVGLTSGVFIGSGLADNTNGTANFVPSSLVSGNYILSYEFTDANNCVNRIDSTITIVQQPFLAYDIPKLDYCNNDARDTLVNVSPSGGTFIGMGMSGSDSSFFPTDIGNVLGSNAITYFYTDPLSGCSDSLRKTLTLHQKPFVNFLDLLVDYCADKGQTISVLTDAPVSGVHSWSLNPDPSAIIVANNQVTLDIDQMSGGTNYNLDYIYTLPSGNSCQDSASGVFLLKPLPVMSFGVTDELGNTLSGDPIRFCQNEDSIVLVGNQNGGLFINNGTQSDIVNLPGSDSAFYSPVSTFDRPGSNLNREINYTFTEPSTGCYNDTTLRTIVNELPTPGGMNGFGVPAGQRAFFCTEDDSTLITGIPPSTFFVRASSYIKMDTSNNGTIGGIFSVGLDSSLFKPKLISKDYVVAYVFTDTAGCTDSVEQDITINAVPDISAAIESPTNTVIDIIPEPYCINDPNLIRLFVNDASSTSNPAADSIVVFTDLTESGTIVRGPSDEWYFRPLNADTLGNHSIQYEYISGGGCRDQEIFQINVLDTPSLSIGNLVPEYCKTNNDRNILLSGNSTIAGLGIFTHSSQIVLTDSGNNTAHFFPDRSAWATGQTITFSLIETVSGESCKDTVIYDVDIFPLPNPGFFMSPTSICIDDNPAQIQPVIAMGSSGNSWIDSSFVYTGIGVDTAGVAVIGEALVFPNSYTPPFTDAGFTDTITFIRTSTKGCIDSLKKSITVHPRPRIFLEIRAKNDTIALFDFCTNQPSRNDLYFGNVDNISPSVAPVFDGIGQVGSEFDPKFSNPGVQPITLEFTTLAGCTSFDTVYANVYLAPTASYVVENFCQYEDIQFTDKSNADTDRDTIFGNIKVPDSVIAWKWFFTFPSLGDTSVLQNPAFKYAVSGDYQTRLEISTLKGCSKDTSTIFHIGEPPIADFLWDEICVGRQVQFKDTTFHDNDLNGWEWVLAPGTISPDTNPAFTYSTPGPYQIRLVVSTVSGCLDTIQKTLDIRPIIGIGGINPDYASDFDNDIIEWRPGSLDDNPHSWEQATPSGNIINSSPDASTTNVWITDADSVHNVGEQSFVMGPCFDFSSSKRPMIRFEHWNETVQGRTGAVLQYSLNKGKAWKTLGDLETGWEWFDSDPIIGNPGDQPFNRIGWSGSTQSKGGWQDSRHQLDELRQNDDVLLRIGFGADDVSAELEGFAFGNVVIGERTKKVIIEHFTNTSDINAQQGDIQHNNLIDNNIYDVYDVQFHTDFPGPDPANLDNPSDNSTRSFIYSVSSVPRTVFEGNQYSGPTFDFTNNFKMVNGDNDLIERRVLEDAIYDVDISSNKTQTGISGAVTITAREDLSNRKLRIQTAIIEAFINSSNFSSPTPLPNSVFKSVMKKMLPDAIGSFVEKSWVAGEQQVFNFNYTYSNVYDPDTINVVAYVQNGTTKEIYQVSSDDSTKVYDPTGGLNSWSIDQSFEFILFPNPTNDQVYIRFEEILDNEVQIRIIDQLGKSILVESLKPNEYEIELDLSALPAGIFYVVVGNDQNKSIKRLVKK